MKRAQHVMSYHLKKVPWALRVLRAAGNSNGLLFHCAPVSVLTLSVGMSAGRQVVNLMIFDLQNQKCGVTFNIHLRISLYIYLTCILSSYFTLLFTLFTPCHPLFFCLSSFVFYVCLYVRFFCLPVMIAQ